MTQPEAAAAEDCYADLHRADRLWLKRTAAELRTHLGRTVRELVRVGEALRKARRRLGRDRWRPWLEHEAQIAHRTAYRYMRVSGVFAAVGPETLRRFSAGALYDLADPGTPAELRSYALEQAEEGAEVSRATVAEWLTAFRDPPVPAPLALASKDARPVAPEPEHAHGADNWRILGALLAPDTTLMLACVADAENGETTVSVTLIGPDGRRRSQTARTLETVLLELSGERREKACKGPCGQVKALDQFSALKGARDGRNKYCLQCERNRVNAYLRTKSAAAKAG